MSDDADFAIPHRRAWTAAAAAVLTHNAEESVYDLPGWAATHPVLPWLDWMASPGAFDIGVAVVSLAVGMLALYAIATGPSWSRLALRVLALVMLINAASHVGLSLATASVMPGSVTALFLLMPVMAVVLWITRHRV